MRIFVKEILRDTEIYNKNNLQSYEISRHTKRFGL